MCKYTHHECKWSDKRRFLHPPGIMGTKDRNKNMRYARPRNISNVNDQRKSNKYECNLGHSSRQDETGQRLYERDKGSCECIMRRKMDDGTNYDINQNSYWTGYDDNNNALHQNHFSA